MFKDSLYSQYIYKSRYARYLDSENRRETWEETVGRYFDFIADGLMTKHKYDISPLRPELEAAVLRHDVMPSMRALMTAGKAAKKNEIALYNCQFAAVDDMKFFDELMAILMSGTGAGFSVEAEDVKTLPELPDHFFESDTTIIFNDSRLGWSKGYREFLSLLMIGQIPKWDVSKLRLKGARLKTMGGRSSGPAPLIDLLNFTKNTFQKAVGRKLTTLECHDLACKVADIVVVGGVRRCCKDTTRVQTSLGYKMIKDIQKSDFIIIGGKSYPVLEKVYSGKQKIIRIHHKFGVIEGVTKNHRVASWDNMSEWSMKDAGNLKVGDALVWDSHGIDGERQILSGFVYNQHFNAKTDIKFPEFLDENLAWLIGLIQGDGYISKGTIEISGNIEDLNMMNAAKNIFKDYFNVDSLVSHDSHDGNGIRLRLNSTSLASWFSENIKKPNEPLKIPSFIFGAERSVRFSYLAGLFDADGRVTPDGGVDQVTTIYETLKNDVVSLLSELGIGSVLYFGSREKYRENGIKGQDYYTVRIKGKLNRKAWENVSAFSSSIKINQLKEYAGKNNDFSWSKELHGNTKGWHEDMSFLTSVEKNITENTGFYPSTITKIEYLEDAETFDIEVEDIHKFTIDGIVVHNSALISLSDLNDDRMRDAKSGNWGKLHPYRRLANNSAVYEETPEMGQFMKEWLSLYESHSGERGIISRKAIKRVIENANDFRRNHHSGIFDGVRFRDPNYKWGCNPCCLDGDTWIHTVYGPKRIKDLVGKKTVVWHNGIPIFSPRGSWISGSKDVYELKTKEGFSIKCTDDHRIMSNKGLVEPKDLIEGDKLHLNKHVNTTWTGKGNSSEGYLLGMFVGDGNWSKAASKNGNYFGQVKVFKKDDGFESLKNSVEDAWKLGGVERRKDAKNWYNYDRNTYILFNISSLPLKFNMNPKDKHDISVLEECSPEFYKGFLKGIFDSDGHFEFVTNASIRLSQVRYDTLQTVQRMLLRLGIFSKIYKQSDERKTMLPDGKGGEKLFDCQACYRLVISSESVGIFKEVVGFSHSKKKKKLDDLNTEFYSQSFEATFQKLELIGEKEVYDIEVNSKEHLLDANGFVVHNSEIILRPYQFCNLTEAVIYEDDTPETIAEKIRIATILGTFQSCFTDFKYINKKYKKNCEDERLLGVSLTGIFDNKFTNGKEFNSGGLEYFLQSLKITAINTNIKLSGEIGINSSVAITCCKPSGCISLDTKIKTKEGIFSAAEIFGKLTSVNIFECIGGTWIEPESDMIVYDENNEEQTITKLFVNGVEVVYEIEMDDGVILKLTADHRLKTSSGWKKAKDLSEDDEILYW